MKTKTYILIIAVIVTVWAVKTLADYDWEAQSRHNELMYELHSQGIDAQFQNWERNRIQKKMLKEMRSFSFPEQSQQKTTTYPDATFYQNWLRNQIQKKNQSQQPKTTTPIIFPVKSDTDVKRLERKIEANRKRIQKLENSVKVLLKRRRK